MRCKNCNAKNKTDANFCENCGSKLSKTTPSKNRAGKRYPMKSKQNTLKALLSIKSLWIFLSLFLGLLLIISIVEQNSSRSLGPNKIFFDEKSDNPFIETSVFEVASNFICSCGSCGEESLDECKCNFAVEQRQFIREYLEKNNDKAAVINAVNTKYGGLKSDNNLAMYESVTESNDSVSNQKLAGLATTNDIYQIYSEFACPCGQCGMDELRECTCTHPNGALEVKGFIDSQIAKNEYTVEDIISQVDSKYGGKKL